MERIKKYRSPLLKDGRLRKGWEEIPMGPAKLDPLKPFSTPGLRMAGQPPRLGEVHIGIHHIRIFRRVA